MSIILIYFGPYILKMDEYSSFYIIMLFFLRVERVSY